jgi:serine/threonine protein kinase
MTNKHGRTKNVAYIVQELIEGGELFDYIMDDGAFAEPIVKFYAR